MVNGLKNLKGLNGLKGPRQEKIKLIYYMNIDDEINKIFSENKITDLKRIIRKRHYLNKSNMYLIYLFHIIQSAGILTTSIATGNNIQNLIWVGIGLNVLASLIHAFEKTNDSISKRLMKDLISIKNGSYIDEGLAVDVEAKDDNASITSIPNPIRKNADPDS